jgi:uncharacterized protein YjbJ (UPF0337 family)
MGNLEPAFPATSPIVENQMNWNQVNGSAKDIAGKIQQRVGEVTGNKMHQAQGMAKQVEGKVRRGVGDVEAFVKASAKT